MFLDEEFGEFSVNGSIIKIIRSLDREIADQHNFTITCHVQTDKSENKSLSQIYTVNVLDEDDNKPYNPTPNATHQLPDNTAKVVSNHCHTRSKLKHAPKDKNEF